MIASQVVVKLVQIAGKNILDIDDDDDSSFISKVFRTMELRDSDVFYVG